MAAIRTADGRLVDPFNPTREDVRPWVLMHAISCLNRYTGHTKYPYSVGQHTLALVRHVPLHLRRAALIHDWAEAWFNDLSTPVKVEVPTYKAAEEKALLFIAGVMHVSEAELEELDPYDKSIYIDERNELYAVPRTNTGMGDERSGLGISAEWFKETNWRVVRAKLNSTFRDLFPEYGDWY